MAKGNIYWCDDCGTRALNLDEIFDYRPERRLPAISWCPGCGRLEDKNGTVTPRDSKKTSGKIGKLALDGLTTDGAHHKQWYFEQILELAVGEEETHDMYFDNEWEIGIAP